MNEPTRRCSPSIVALRALRNNAFRGWNTNSMGELANTGGQVAQFCSAGLDRLLTPATL